MNARTAGRLLFVFVCICLGLAAQQTSTAPLTIIVTDIKGAAIAHAQIRVVPAANSSAKLETDEKGRLSLDLKPGGYALFVQSPGFKKAANHVEVQSAHDAQSVSVVLQIADAGGPVAVQPASSKDSLLVLAFPYHQPWNVSAAEFKSMPHVTVMFHNTHTNVDESYSGVRLSDLLSRVGAPLGDELRGEALANYIVATGSDGYQAVLSLAEVDPAFHPGDIVVADSMNGAPLDAHSGPFKLVVTEDKRPARSVRNLTTLELKVP